MKFLFTLPFLLSLSGCNFNQFLATSEEQNAIDQLLTDSRYEFDKGNYDEALTKAVDAYNIDPSFEDSSVLIGYIYLSKSGLDIFNLSRSLISESEGTTNDKTSQLFSSLSEVLGVDSTELGYLSSGDSNTIGGRQVFIPKDAVQARVSESLIIGNINQAISFFCPFVDEEAKLLDESGPLNDSRHSLENCPPTEFARTSSGKANFGWSLAHLGEAVAFYSVLFFRDDGETKSNLELGVAALESVSNPSAYASEIDTLAVTIDAVFPTDTDNASTSMLNAMFNNLEVTNRGFGAAGAPEDLTESISKAITDIKSTTDQISSSTANTKAMKEKLTKKLSQDLSQQIEDLDPSGDELSDICNSFRQINEGQPEPENCSGVQ